MRDIKKILTTYSFYLLPLLVVLGIVILSATLLFPALTSIAENRLLLATKKTELAALLTKKDFLNAFDTSYLPLLKDAELALPTEKDAASMLFAMDNLAAKTGAGVSSIDLNPGVVSTDSASSSAAAAAPVADKYGANVLGAKIAVAGSAIQIKDFITQLTSSRRLLDIDTVNFSFSPDADFIDSSMTISGYYLAPPGQLGATSDVLPQLTTADKEALTQVASLPVMSILLAGDTPVDLNGEPVGKTNLFVR